MYCRKCGSEMKDGCKFCPKCGTPVKPINSNQSHQENKQENSSDPKTFQTTLKHWWSSFINTRSMPLGGLVEIIAVVFEIFAFLCGQYFMRGIFASAAFGIFMEIALGIIGLIIVIWAQRKHGYTIIGTIGGLLFVLNVVFLIILIGQLIHINHQFANMEQDFETGQSPQ